MHACHNDKGINPGKHSHRDKPQMVSNPINHTGQHISNNRSERTEYKKCQQRANQDNQQRLQKILGNFRRDTICKLLDIPLHPYRKDDRKDGISVLRRQKGQKRCLLYTL